MDHHEYIDSGILQDHCLGLLSNQEMEEVREMGKLHPEIMQELARVQNVLEELAKQRGMKPEGRLKAAIWNTLQNLDKEDELSLTNLPVIDKHSNSQKWLSLVEPLLPHTIEAEDEFTMLLQDTGKIMQKVYRSRRSYADEVHHHIFESILVLEGKCTCKIDDQYFDFVAGDCISIPLHVVHNLTVTSPSITFVVQHLAA